MKNYKEWMSKITVTYLYLLAIISVTVLILTNQYVIQRILGTIENYNEAVIETLERREMTMELIIQVIDLQSPAEDLRNLKEQNERWDNSMTNYHSDISSIIDDEIDFQALSKDQKALYTSINQLKLGQVLSVNDGPLKINGRPLIDNLDKIVTILENKSREEVKQLEFLEIVLAVISILILWLEARFIFLPVMKEMNRRKLELEKLNESKDRILATVAHDIRNPLTAIGGVLELLKEDLGELSEENQTLIDMASQSGKKAEALIQELLDLSLLESEEFHLNTEITHLEQYLAGLMFEFKSRAEAKNIDLKLQVTPHTLQVVIDKERFSRVIENLLSNAIKFTEEGKVEVFSFEENSEVMITIKDTGIGIPDKLKEYIFDKFSKARRTGTQGEATTGLGMSIVKTIVEKHGGTIWLESEAGRGTVYYISLPM